MSLRQRKYLSEIRDAADPVLKKLKKASFGDKLVFHGETGAATGAGKDAKKVFYFVMMKKGREGVYLSKKKPSNPDRPFMDVSHIYRPRHRMGLGAILPLGRSSSRPNAMTLGFIDKVEVTK